jgi:hypothetical protein
MNFRYRNSLVYFLKKCFQEYIEKNTFSFASACAQSKPSHETSCILKPKDVSAGVHAAQGQFSQC